MLKDYLTHMCVLKERTILIHICNVLLFNTCVNLNDQYSVLKVETFKL